MGLSIAQAFAPVRDDLQRFGLPVPRIDEAPDEDLANWIPEAEVIVDLEGEQFPLSSSDGAADRIVTVADRVQEWIIESVLWPDRPTNWPPCPAHPDTHPLSARSLGGAAAWCCPVSGATVSEIGQLPGTVAAFH